MMSRCTSIHALSSLLMLGALVALPAACTEAVDDPDEPTEELDTDFDPTTKSVTVDRVQLEESAPSDQPIFWDALTNLCGATYDDSNMQGAQNNMTNNTQIAFTSRRVSAVAVGPNCTMKLKTNGGSSKNFTGTGGGTYYSFVGSDWNDRADRAECTCTVAPEIGAMVYEDANYGGNSVPIWDGADGSLAAFWNDRVTSLKVQTGSQLVLFENSPTGGKAYTSSGGSSSNVGTSFNDKASSFVSGGTYWPACAPVRFCSQTRTDCSGLGVIATDMIDCFQARNYTSFCQEAVNGSVCIPRSSTPF
jgi:hypothetical protein